MRGEGLGTKKTLPSIGLPAIRPSIPHSVHITGSVGVQETEYRIHLSVKLTLVVYHEATTGQTSVRSEKLTPAAKGTYFRLWEE